MVLLTSKHVKINCTKKLSRTLHHTQCYINHKQSYNKIDVNITLSEDIQYILCVMLTCIQKYENISCDKSIIYSFSNIAKLSTLDSSVKAKMWEISSDTHQLHSQSTTL